MTKPPLYLIYFIMLLVCSCSVFNPGTHQDADTTAMDYQTSDYDISQILPEPVNENNGEYEPLSTLPDDTPEPLITETARITPAVNREESIDTAPASSDIWKRLRAGYKLDPSIDHARIDTQLKWYAAHGDYLNRVNKRASRYLFHILDEIEKRNMPSELALLPIVESAFDPFAYSHGRA
ncbi:MAG: hypothetical protein KDI30_07780, partial [Pseudomonadales bacterium]|nr:hypothetical protein [Pseudomonadales bacterium]